MPHVIVFSDATRFGDDGVALAMLAADPRITIDCVVATSGNVWSIEAVENLRAILAALGRKDVPVRFGGFEDQRIADEAASRRIAHDPGVLYAGALATPLPPRASSDDVDALADRIAAGGPADWLVLGPATTPAMLLRRRPTLRRNIREIYMMGGALAAPGNATRAAEFNVWFDPAAADALFRLDTKLTLVPLDVLQGFAYARDLADRLDPSSPAASYLASCLSARSDQIVCDEILSAVFVDPGIILRDERIRLSVRTGTGSRHGVLERSADPARPAVRVVSRLDEARLFKTVARRLPLGPRREGEPPGSILRLSRAHSGADHARGDHEDVGGT